MGFFTRFKRYIQKIYYTCRGQLDRFQARAYFPNGGTAVYTGPPRGQGYADWKDLIRYAVYVETNYQGKTRRFTCDDSDDDSESDMDSDWSLASVVLFTIHLFTPYNRSQQPLVLTHFNMSKNFGAVMPYGWDNKQLAVSGGYGSQQPVKFKAQNEERGITFQYSGPEGATSDKALKIAKRICK